MVDTLIGPSEGTCVRSKQVRLSENQVVDAEMLDFTVTKDPWTEIRTEDGTVLQMKYLISEVLRLKGGLNEIGEPIFIVRSANVVRIVPEDRP